MNELKVAAGQFAVSANWQENLVTIRSLITDAESQDVDLLVLPEGCLARFIDRRERIREEAQALDGPFASGVREATEGLHVAVVLGIHETSSTSRPYNTLLALRDGQVLQFYRKLHLYDAFNALESDNVTPADSIPDLIDIEGFKVGLMTCYDLRFPELARLLALRGADVLALPAAWAKGPSKEFHWSTLVSARALDNTIYMVASGESGAACIGRSMITDPLGLPIVQALEDPQLIVATISKSRLRTVRNSLPVLNHRRFNIDPNPRQPTPVGSTPIV